MVHDRCSFNGTFLVVYLFFVEGEVEETTVASLRSFCLDAIKRR